jgi:cytochrome c-type biogenesis protein
MEAPVAFAAAFAAGLLSFFSPYVLPLIPGYLSYISGLSLDEIRGAAGARGARGVAVGTRAEARRRVLTTTVAFCGGFSAVFILMGASAGAIAEALPGHERLLERIGGVIVTAFGLHTIGLFRLARLQRPKRVMTRNKPPGLAGALLVGLAFAVGWTPNLGPLLAVILTLAVTQGTISQGARLLAGFSLGLALPFVATSLALNRYYAAFARLRGHLRALESVAGAFLIAIGLLMFFDGNLPAIA